MMRRSYVAALAALSALALLVLASLPPSPPAPPPAPAVALPRAANASRPAPLPPAEAPQNVTKATPASVEKTVKSVKSVKKVEAKTPKVAVLGPTAATVGSLYVAGHSRPHPELCPALGANLKLFVMVTSAPSHAPARLAIRYTWGHFKARADVSIAFIIGAPPPALRKTLEAEDALYGDIIMGNFVDTYTNLTLKTLSALEWLDTYCPRVRRILKTDDDMFINVPKLLQFIEAKGDATRTLWGKVIKNSRPKRTPKSKYCVSYAQYPNKTFPDFTTGPAYLMSADVVSPLLRAAPARPYLPLEDVFFTGVLAAALNVSRVHAPEFYNRKVTHACSIQRGVSVHMVQYREQFELWRRLLDGGAKCR